MTTCATNAGNLPNDAEALRALVLSMIPSLGMISERNALAAERDALLEHNERLHHLLLKLNRMQFGRKSERLPEDQRQLALEDSEQAIAKANAEAEKRDPELRKQHGASVAQAGARCRRICRGSRSR